MRHATGCTLVLLLLALGVADAANPLAGLLGRLTGKSAIAKVACPDEVRDMLHVDTAKLQSIKDQMILQMKQGLAGEESPMLMLPTHLSQKPTGEEKGSYLALDLGGTNFRVLKVVLKGKGKFEVLHSKHKVEESLMSGPGENLFRFFAEKVRDMAPETVGAETAMPLGFTFSFPVLQTSINVGTLVEWTKGFSCSGVEGQDVVNLLQKAFRDLNINISVEALVNDTPGTMMAGAYKNPNVAAGLILGTGTNLCFLQTVAQAPKLQDKRAFNALPSVVTWRREPFCGPNAQHIVNTEWGGFGDGRAEESLPMCKHDKELDAKSVNPGKHLYEKMIGGMFLGELTRRFAADLIEQGKLFSHNKNLGNKLEGFVTEGGFSTECMSRLEGSRTYEEARAILKSLGVVDSKKADIDLLRAVCVAVSDRAALLAGAGLAAVAEHLKREHDCLVAVDGTLFAKYPKIKDRMLSCLKTLLGRRMGVRFVSAEDGSGVGAALAAAAACAK